MIRRGEYQRAFQTFRKMIHWRQGTCCYVRNGVRFTRGLDGSINIGWVHK